MESSLSKTRLAWRLLAGIFFVIVSTLLSGCVRQLVSVADLPENRERDGRGQLLVPGLGVIIRASNETPRSWLEIPRYFKISLWFAPTRSGFQFDPQQVRLIFPDRRIFTPERVWTVSNASDPSRVHVWDCWSNRRTPIEGKPPYALKEIGYCFEISFEVEPPAPDTPFSMHIDYLTVDGKSVGVPEINFKKGSFWIMGLPGK